MKNALVVSFSIVLLTLLSITTVSAEQIRLSTGKFIQGDIVGDPTDEGFKFKLTKSGGTIFLRWSQIDEKDATRLKKVEDPNTDLSLHITAQGSRLELLTGDVIEGDIKEYEDHYIVNNVDNKNKKISKKDVTDFQPAVQISATSIMSPEEVLESELEAAEPTEAKEYYRFAKLAERLGLYAEARDYAEEVLAAAPSAKLQGLAEELSEALSEIIRQEAFLESITQARKLARKSKFQMAVDVIDEVVKTGKPTKVVAEKLQEVRDEIDADFSAYVIKKWYKLMYTVTTKKLREEKEFDLNAARTYLRGQLDLDILDSLSETTGGKPQDIKSRFEKRNFEKVKLHKASFGKDGWYDLIPTGYLPSSGKKKDDSEKGKKDPRKKKNNKKDPRGGSKGGDRDGFEDAAGPSILPPISGGSESFQDSGSEEAPGIDRDLVKEIIKQLEEDEKNAKTEKEEKAAAARPAAFKRPKFDKKDPKREIPETVPSIKDWWERASKSKKRNWIVALYAYMGGTMAMIDQKYEVIYFK